MSTGNGADRNLAREVHGKVGEQSDRPSYILDQLSPVLSDTLAPVGGGGWTRIYFWCTQTAAESCGSLRNNPLLDRLDILVIRVDADVVGKSYTNDQRISSAPNDLPCPSASATTDELRKVLLGWIGEIAIPPKIFLCTLSKALETWILVALFPLNRFAAGDDVECRANPETQLQSQSLDQRLIRSGKKDRRKCRDENVPATSVTRCRACGNGAPKRNAFRWNLPQPCQTNEHDVQFPGDYIADGAANANAGSCFL